MDCSRVHVGIVVLYCTVQSRRKSANQAARYSDKTDIQTGSVFSLSPSLEHPQQAALYSPLPPPLPSTLYLSIHPPSHSATRQHPQTHNPHTQVRQAHNPSLAPSRQPAASGVNPSRCAWPAPQILNLQPRCPGFA